MGGGCSAIPPLHVQSTKFCHPPSCAMAPIILPTQCVITIRWYASSLSPIRLAPAPEPYTYVRVMHPCSYILLDPFLGMAHTQTHDGFQDNISTLLCRNYVFGWNEIGIIQLFTFMSTTYITLYIIYIYYISTCKVVLAFHDVWELKHIYHRTSFINFLFSINCKVVLMQMINQH
jgi:hypothetical protein